MKRAIPKYGVRRFIEYRHDRRCFELYEIATGECASFPCTKKQGEAQAKTWNAEHKEESPS